MNIEIYRLFTFFLKLCLYAFGTIHVINELNKQDSVAVAGRDKREQLGEIL